MSDSVHQISLRKIAWVVGLLALALSILSVSLVHRYGETRPTAGDSSRPHAVKIHSRVVYLTTGEYATAFGSQVLTVLAVGSFLGVLLKSRARKT